MMMTAVAERSENKVGDMLRQALEQADLPVKALAIDVNYSEDAIYAAMKGKRKIPRDARKCVAGLHPLGGLAVAYQETGYRCFLIMDGDHHPQNVLQKALKEDNDVDGSLQGMGIRLIDKMKPEDLTEEDRQAMRLAAKEIIEEIRALFTVLVVWQNQYEIESVKMLLEALDQKERAAIKTAR